MVQEIIHDPMFLARKATEAAPEDITVGMDLMDTLRANTAECVGMAANMIGVCKRIIVFSDQGKQMIMFNPYIVGRKGEYEAEEGCLSLAGIHKAKRARTIRVAFRDASWRMHTLTYSGFTAQIIQHEIDHCEGILI